MSRTDKTRPFWVRQQDPSDHTVYISPCGSGCSYCGMGRTRRKFARGRSRQQDKRFIRNHPEDA